MNIQHCIPGESNMIWTNKFIKCVCSLTGTFNPKMLIHKINVSAMNFIQSTYLQYFILTMGQMMWKGLLVGMIPLRREHFPAALRSISASFSSLFYFKGPQQFWFSLSALIILVSQQHQAAVFTKQPLMNTPLATSPASNSCIVYSIIKLLLLMNSYVCGILMLEFLKWSKLTLNYCWAVKSITVLQKIWICKVTIIKM